MFRAIYYSLRNLLLHRYERQIAPHLIKQFRNTTSIEECRRLITEMLLFTVGLRIAENEEFIPRHIYLTSLQRQIIEQVSKFGFEAALE